MKILWLTNVATPDIAKSIGMPVNHGGGWLTQTSEYVAANNDLTMIFPMPQEIEQKEGKYNAINYRGFTFIKKPEEIETLKLSFSSILSDIKPDIIHIWGTEYLHAYAMLQACKNLDLLDRTIISIQGLVSVYKDYYWCYINDESVKKPTFRDYIRKAGPYYEYQDFCLRSEYEERILKEAKHVIGRTDWDFYHTKKLNPNVNYHFCNETLRQAFYTGKWSLEKCEKHRIFMSQGNYPIKGLHLALQGLQKLVKKYPDVILACTGKNRVNPTLKEILSESSYDRYIRKLIKKYNLGDHIQFLGSLDEQGMKEQYLKANIFLSASSIENSPNSVGEAMLLGTPVVSSNVGGVSTMIEDGKEGMLYATSDVDQMVNCIEKLFKDDVYAETISSAEITKARVTHDIENNYNQMVAIYSSLTQTNN